MRKPRGTKPDDIGLVAPRNGPTKSPRRILRPIASWDIVSGIIAVGGKPNLDDLCYLLRLGEPVPPDVQSHLADRLDPRPTERGRPKKHPGQIKSDQWRSARTLYHAINRIRTDERISLARAFKVYAAIKKVVDAKSVEREYRAAKKILVADLRPPHFLSFEDYVSWETERLKKRKNK